MKANSTSKHSAKGTSNVSYAPNLISKSIREHILWDPTLVGEGNETFLIRVWKPLPSRHVLKSWAWQRYVKGQSEQYLLAVNLDGYKWYQGQTPGGVPARTLAPKGVDCESPRWLERETKHFL